MYLLVLICMSLLGLDARKHRKSDSYKFPTTTSSSLPSAAESLSSSPFAHYVTEDGRASTASLTADYAICLTGQLVRLELGSKIQNLLQPNLMNGHSISLFVLLDNDVNEVKGVKNSRRFLPERTLYSNYDARNLVDTISRYFRNRNYKFSLRVRFEKPGVKEFLTYKKPPVFPAFQNKFVNGTLDSRAAFRRFQNHMRWQSGLRECMKWVQHTEVEQGRHYDFVMRYYILLVVILIVFALNICTLYHERLREDSFIFDKMVFDAQLFSKKLVSLDINTWRGINDHNIIVDRSYADSIFRGLSEDYYFNIASHGEFWNNPESLLRNMTRYYGVESLPVSVCLFPILTIYKRHDSISWNLRKASSNKGVVKAFALKCTHTSDLAKKLSGEGTSFLKTARFMEPDYSVALSKPLPLEANDDPFIVGNYSTS